MNHQNVDFVAAGQAITNNALALPRFTPGCNDNREIFIMFVQTHEPSNFTMLFHLPIMQIMKCKLWRLMIQSYVRIRHDMRVASTQLHLLVFATLNGTSREAIIFVDLDVILFWKAAVSLCYAHVPRFRIVLNIFDRQLTSVKKYSLRFVFKADDDQSLLVVNKLIDLQNVRLGRNKIGNLVVSNGVHKAFSLNFDF